MKQSFQMPEQVDQLVIMSAIADVIAEAFILADLEEPCEYPSIRTQELCAAVAKLRATGWRPDLVTDKTKRSEHEKKDSTETS